MRTNTIDALAFRCLAEYKRFVDIYVKLMETPLDYLCIEYITELDNLETAKEIRKHHRDALEEVKTNISEQIEKRIMTLNPSKPVNFKVNKNI